MNILDILNDLPYGTKRSFNGLRMATVLSVEMNYARYRAKAASNK